MSNLDDEIARLEAEQESENATLKPCKECGSLYDKKKNKVCPQCKPAENNKPVPKPNTNPLELFPNLSKYSERAKQELAEQLAKRENGSNPEVVQESAAPSNDERKSEQTGEQAILKKAAQAEFDERMADCGFCQICQQCRIYIYNSYKAEIHHLGAKATEDRVHVHKKACIAAIERERASRDHWEEVIRKESEEIQLERRDADGRYVIPDPPQGKKISKGAKDIADRNKPAKRIAKDERMAAKLAEHGIDFKAMLLQMSKFNESLGQKKP